jgi:hypothetical protein
MTNKAENQDVRIQPLKRPVKDKYRKTIGRDVLYFGRIKVLRFSERMHRSKCITTLKPPLAGEGSPCLPNSAGNFYLKFGNFIQYWVSGPNRLALFKNDESFRIPVRSLFLILAKQITALSWPLIVESY